MLKSRNFVYHMMVCQGRCLAEVQNPDLTYVGGAAVVEWLSSWLAEQEVWGLIPGLVLNFRDWLSKSLYG